MIASKIRYAVETKAYMVKKWGETEKSCRKVW